MARGPYEILGVAQSASQDAIKDAYRKLAKKHHPDLNPGNKGAEKLFKEINAAYEVLGTPETRAKFDRGEVDAAGNASASASQGERARPERQYYRSTQGPGSRYGRVDDDFLNSIFGQMGGQMGGGSSGFGYTGDMPGQDVSYQMDIDFDVAIHGGEREITLPGGKRLRVKIPAGVESGARLRFAGQGGPGMSAGGQGSAASASPAFGDAYVQLNVKPSSLYKREGRDLEIELPISVSEAILGGEIKVPSVDGPLLLKIPAGVSSGQRLRIPGKGVPAHGVAQKRGDQYVILKVVAPPTIDADFKQAVESWTRRQPFNPRRNWAGEASEGSGA